MANNDIGKRIADRRKELHLSQTQLAEMTGYSDKTACCGERPFGAFKCEYHVVNLRSHVAKDRR